MSKKTKQTSHTVTTPTNPDWVNNSIQGLSGQIGGLAKLDPYSLIAPTNALQTQAGQTAAGLGGNAAQYASLNNKDFVGGLGIDQAKYAALSGAAAPQVQSSSLLDGLSGYMSPYTNDVVNTTLQGFDHNAGMTRAQQSLDMANSGAFGGSGSALTRSMTEDGLARTRAGTEAQLRDQAFNTGAGLSNMDAGRRQDASSQNASLSQQQTQMNLQAMLAGDQNNRANAGLGMQQQQNQLQALLSGDENTRANIGMQAGLGGDLRNIDQQRLGAPISLLQTQAGLTGALPYNLFNGNVQDGKSTTTTSDPMGTLGSLALMAAAPFTGGASLGLGGLLGAGGGLAGMAGALKAGASIGQVAKAAGGLASVGGFRAGMGR